MKLRNFSNTVNALERKIEQEMTGRKIAEGLGFAAVFGLVTGIIIAHKHRNRTIKDIDNKSFNSTIRIEMKDLQKLKIESIE